MKQPTMQYWTWSNAWPQFFVLTFLTVAWLQLLSSYPRSMGIIAGAGTFLAWSQGSRFFLCADHRRGMRAFAKKDYGAAIEFFRKSVSFFLGHAWIDRYRAWTLLSASAWTYREMGLMNIAACYSRTGEFATAARTYSEIVSEFPENELAVHALQVFSTKSDGDEA